MEDRKYSVFKDALFPVDKILCCSYNVALSELWEGKINTYKALAELEKHSIIWDLSEIKKIYSVINYHILYQDRFSCEIKMRDGFDGNIKDVKFTDKYLVLTRKQLLLLGLILCNDVLYEDVTSQVLSSSDGMTIIKTENYTMKLQNPAMGMPGTRFEFEVPGKFELVLFAYKS